MLLQGPISNTASKKKQDAYKYLLTHLSQFPVSYKLGPGEDSLKEFYEEVKCLDSNNFEIRTAFW